MPGLIDVHIHAYANDVVLQKIDAAGETYRAAHAAKMLGLPSTVRSGLYVWCCTEGTWRSEGTTILEWWRTCLVWRKRP